MMRFDSIDGLQVPWGATAVSIGNFDGVHVGHAALVTRLRDFADARGVPAVILTFDPHPAAVLHSRATFVPLSWPERKERLLKELGADEIVFLRADTALFSIDAESFFHDVLCRRLHIRGLVEGPDFRFGRDRTGDIRVLQRLSGSQGVDVAVVPKVECDGGVVSSSRIRRMVEAGEVERANRCLVAPYRIVGRVVRGAGRGASIGFPTANLEEVPNLIPGKGVYAARVEGLDRDYAAAVHIGPNPTFGEDRLKVEAHLIGWSGSLLGRRLEIEFLRRLRGVARFASPEELVAQLERDVAAAAKAGRSAPP